MCHVDTIHLIKLYWLAAHYAEFKYIPITAFTTSSKLNFTLYRNFDCFTCTRAKLPINYTRQMLAASWVRLRLYCRPARL